MNLSLGLIACLILVTAVVAMSLRSLIHTALVLVVTWFGIAAFYLWAGAEFVAFAQILIYAGAISMVVLFAVLLTRPFGEISQPVSASHRGRVGALAIGAAVAGIMAYAVLNTSFIPSSPVPPTVSVRELGIQLMNTHLAAVLIVGLILTSALIGSVVIAAAPSTSDEESAR